MTIFADPTTVTLIYYTAATTNITTPIPEYPTALYVILIGCLVMTIFVAKRSSGKTIVARKMGKTGLRGRNH